MADPFEVMRRRAKQQGETAKQQGLDVLSRRQAQLGGGPSGAFVKLEQEAGRLADEATEKSLEGINLQEAQQKLREKEIKQAQEFQAGEAGKQREFAGGEALKQREFAGAETEKQRGFQKGLFDIEQAFKERIQGFNENFQTSQLELMNKQFNLDEEITRFNQAISSLESSYNLPRIQEQMAGLRASYVPSVGVGTPKAKGPTRGSPLYEELQGGGF